MPKKTISLFIDPKVLADIDLVANTKVYEHIEGRSELIERILGEWVQDNPEVMKAASHDRERAFVEEMTTKAATGYGFTIDPDVIRKLLKEQQQKKQSQSAS